MARFKWSRLPYSFHTTCSANAGTSACQRSRYICRRVCSQVDSQVKGIVGDCGFGNAAECGNPRWQGRKYLSPGCTASPAIIIQQLGDSRLRTISPGQDTSIGGMFHHSGATGPAVSRKTGRQRCLVLFLQQKAQKETDDIEKCFNRFRITGLPFASNQGAAHL